MELWIGAVNLGLLYAFMALGTFITYKIFDFPDITVDGSFTLGAAVVSFMMMSGVNHLIALPLVFLSGMIAGAVTGLIHTKFRINGLLSGILVMTGLYSVNLRIMGKSNVALIGMDSLISMLDNYNPGLHSEIWYLIIFAAFTLFVWIILAVFFKTDFGIIMRGTGDNSVMVAANAVNIDFIKVFGIALSNGLVALSGALVAQYQGFSDIGMGVGAVVFSLAAVIIGEAIFKSPSVTVKILSVITGSIIFRIMVAAALIVGLNPNDLKLITAIFVLLTLIASNAFDLRRKLGINKPDSHSSGKSRKPLLLGTLIIFLVAGTFFLYNFLSSDANSEKHVKIGVVLGSDATILTLTHEGFIQEMKNLGYVDGENCEIIMQNGFGEIPTINSIVDNFISSGVDVFIPISTASLQACLNKVKDKPIVFGTIANPFIVKAGTTPTDHLPNVTGVYGTMPIADLIEKVRTLYPGKLKFGVMWNSSFPNSLDNVKVLRKAVEKYNGEITLEGMTITNSNEVFQTAQALVNKEIDAFFLIPDITVFAAFEAIVKAGKPKNIPIFTGDVEKLVDGALMVYGYDYIVSGRQTARLVKRVLDGENITKIPFEKYHEVCFGINYDMASALNVSFPDSFKTQASMTVKNGKLFRREDRLDQRQIKKLALFQFSDNLLLNSTADGFFGKLENENHSLPYKILIDKYNANGDFGVGNTIVGRILEAKYDFIATVSTKSGQLVSTANKNIPHVFMAVTDPIVAKIVSDFEKHDSHLTGLATPQPVNSTVRLMREVFPKAKRIGIVWNNAEINSEICTEILKKSAPAFGFTVIERTINNSSEIIEAVNSVIIEGIDIFITSGDVTVSQAISSIAQRLEKYKIPFFTNTPNDVNDGALITLGADYQEVGEEAALQMIEIINGKSPGDIPVKLFVPEKIGVNLTLAKKIGINIPDWLIKKAELKK